MRKLIATTFAILSLAMLPRAAQALPLDGTLILINGEVRVTAAGEIDWLPLGNGTGTANVGSLSDGYFDPLTGFTVVEKDLALGTTVFPVDAFETITGTGANFVLDGFALCTTAFCPGGDTTSIFNFIESDDGQGGTNTTVQLNAFGTFTDNVLFPGHTATWTGQFSADFTGFTAADLIGMLENPDIGYIETGFSGRKLTVEEVSEVPEPASMLLLGSGLVGLAAARRRNKK